MNKWLGLVAGLAAAFLFGGCVAAPENGPEELTLARVFDAVQTLKGVAVVSDLVPAGELPDGDRLYLKLETQQRIGAFKVRGAYYLMSRLTPEEQARGVVTCSAGNHAQGVGFAADEFGIRATIFLPASAPETKVRAVRAYRQADVRLVEGSFDDALKAALAFRDATGAVYIPPFDDIDVIAGQGTIGWELMEQLPEADAVVAPIGGGGLISGVAFAVKSLKPSCRVYGVEAAGAASMLRSLEAGRPVTLDHVSTIADGSAVRRPGDLTYALCDRYVDAVVTVEEEEIEDAIRRLCREYGVVAEGAGALSVAAALNGKIPASGNVVCIVSGGNIDRAKLEEILERHP